MITSDYLARALKEFLMSKYPVHISIKYSHDYRQNLIIVNRSRPDNNRRCTEMVLMRLVCCFGILKLKKKKGNTETVNKLSESSPK